MNYGIFISYRRTYSFFAGRINDYLSNQGLSPFMDVYRMPQANVVEEIIKRINECPYFLLVLGQGCFSRLKKGDIFYIEIQTALKCKAPEDILIVMEKDFSFQSADHIPEEFLSLFDHQCDTITHERFTTDMEHFIENIQFEKLIDILNWKELLAKKGRTLVSSRSVLENGFCSIENRFGRDLIEAVRNGRHFKGVQRIKQIRISCYAANIIFNPGRRMVDDRAYDNGLLFNTFGELLRDPEFSMEILITAPDSIGAQEAIRNRMLGNRALEDHPEAVFLSAYAGLYRLISEVPEFKQAYQERRFRFYLTDVVMTGAIFQIQYKTEWNEFDHVKYDMYSYSLASNMDRRSMVFFRNDQDDNYNSILRSYEYMRVQRYKQEEVAAHHNEWIDAWNRLQEVI